MQIDPLHGLDLDRALHDAAGPVLVVVTKPGCGACRAVRAALADTPAPAGLRTVEVDASTAPALVDELAIFHLPALWVFVGGEPVGPVNAPPIAARLATAIGETLASGVTAPNQP